MTSSRFSDRGRRGAGSVGRRRARGSPRGRARGRPCDGVGRSRGSEWFAPGDLGAVCPHAVEAHGGLTRRGRPRLPGADPLGKVQAPVLGPGEAAPRASGASAARSRRGGGGAAAPPGGPAPPPPPPPPPAVFPAPGGGGGGG